ncbi:hypothetical protein IQ07DRAFT_190789 [Pyrenochaeta sp. DS3sAY3a]|nr:hypothetical protein IQ07DRAFT_190789 [Pyrenochaeta sp. DS3sAY3a]
MDTWIVHRGSIQDSLSTHRFCVLNVIIGICECNVEAAAGLVFDDIQFDLRVFLFRIFKMYFIALFVLSRQFSSALVDQPAEAIFESLVSPTLTVKHIPNLGIVMVLHSDNQSN